jgi:hypothetical protein
MSRIVLALLASIFAVSVANAFEKRLLESLKKLEPETRFHQVCDIETMRRIKAEGGALKPDRMVMDAVAPAAREGDVLTGAGGAVRSGGKWYRLSFSCRASEDRMQVLALSYRVGGEIPEAEWELYGLWR